ncbi:carbohydrate binding domain-containing protein, partial [Motilibacter deserti]|nr:hypothetical protein [Motilibacter deserti]
MAALAVSGLSALPQSLARADEPDIAVGAVATATSSESATYSAALAVDGDPATRWASTFSDPQTITLDLGSRAHVTGVTLLWEAAFGKAYTIESSLDGSTWSPLASATDGDGGTDDFSGLSADARYLRLTGTVRATAYGYSLYSFQVHGTFSEQAVSLTASSAQSAEGAATTLHVRLNKASESPVSVNYATADGTAVAGRDYVAAAGTLTFAPGEVDKTVVVAGIEDTTDEPAETLKLDLSAAAPAGTLISPRSSATVTLLDDDEAPLSGGTRTIDDFDGGSVPNGVFNFGGRGGADNPTLSVVAADRPGASAGNTGLDVPYSIVEYGGFTHDLSAPQDWRDYDGFSFWVKGTGTGGTVQFEIKDGSNSAGSGELWESTFKDDTSQWKQVRVLFKDLKRRASYQPPGAPTDGVLDLDRMWGYAVNLPSGSGHFVFDQVQLFENVRVIEDFEAPNPPVNPSGSPEGILGFQGDSSKPVVITLPERARDGVTDNHLLSAAYDTTTSYAGVSHNLSFNTDPQDWSSFGGLRFWWYGQNVVPPAAPGGGKRINIEVKDGGANAEASELWTTSFTDDWVGWHLVELPWSQFQYRGDYQPVGGINHVLDLDRMWGLAFTAPTGSVGKLEYDQIEVYGTPAVTPTVSVSTDAPVYTLDEGETAHVGVRVTATGGAPLASDVTVAYSTGNGSATAGADYTAVSGQLVFPAGTASGTVKTFDVTALVDGDGEVAETIPVALSGGPGVSVTQDLPTLVVNAHGLPYLDASLSTEARVADLLSRMTLAEKVGQMTQAERNALKAQDDIASYELGSLLSGGGSTPTPNTAEAWADMVDSYQLRAQQTRLQVPLLYGVDSVHGHNNVVGATIFPHNIGLGAMRNPALVEQVEHVVATETRATGPQWAFSPCVCVAQDDRWGRTYESFGEDPALVIANETAIDGLQGKTPAELKNPDRVLASTKHFAGDGGTTYNPDSTGYKIDQGVSVTNRPDFEKNHLAPYVPAVQQHHTGTIMP